MLGNLLRALAWKRALKFFTSLTGPAARPFVDHLLRKRFSREGRQQMGADFAEIGARLEVDDVEGAADWIAAAIGRFRL